VCKIVPTHVQSGGPPATPSFIKFMKCERGQELGWWKYCRTSIGGVGLSAERVVVDTVVPQLRG